MTVPDDLVQLISGALAETLQMVAIAAFVAALAGVPLGVLLTVTDRGGVRENLTLNRIVGAIVNATRSTPFIILMVAIIPFTRLVVHTSIGTAAAIVPLSVAAIPFFGRLVQASLREVPESVVEAALAMGAAAINGNYAATAGLTPGRDALFAEGGGVGEALRSVYSNVIAVRSADQSKPWVKELVGIYQSSALRGFIIRHFGGSIYPAF